MAESFAIRTATLADVPIITAHRRAMFEEMGFTHHAELNMMDKNFAEWVAKKIAAKNYQHWFALDEWNAISAGAGLWLMEWPPHAS
ncbi:MAG: GNAT family N-acetyltransferase, partial [Chloroflexi bacterium]|nr:GNAT family N-acetyltransferase [Chloroflexota bacterium]